MDSFFYKGAELEMTDSDGVVSKLIIDVLPDHRTQKIRLIDENQAPVWWTKQEFEQLIGCEKLRLVHPLLFANSIEDDETYLTNLTDRQLEQVRKRDAVLAIYRERLNESDSPQYAYACATQFCRDEGWSTISQRTLQRWLKDETNGVVPKKPGPPKGGTRYPKGEVELVKRFLDKERKTGRGALNYRMLTAAINCALLDLSEQERRARQLRDNLSEDTIRRVAKKLYGKRGMESFMSSAAERRKVNRITPGQITANNILERVQLDATPIDSQTVEDLTGATTRGVLYLAIDVYSRMVLGVHFSVDAENTADALVALLNALLPKSNYPQAAWGKIGTVYNDGGKAFRGVHFVGSLKQLGIKSVTAKGDRAWLRGIVERAFRTAHTRLIDQLPGATRDRSSPTGTDSSRANGMPKLTVEQLNQHLQEFFYQVHSNSALPKDVRRGNAHTPQAVWNVALQESPPRIPVPKHLIQNCHVHVAKHKVRHDGVRYSQLRYAGEGLKRLMYDYRDVSEIDVYINPLDSSRIWVSPVGYAEARYVLEAVDKEITIGRTFSEVQRILRLQNVQRKSINRQADLETLKLVRKAQAQAKANHEVDPSKKKRRKSADLKLSSNQAALNMLDQLGFDPNAETGPNPAIQTSPTSLVESDTRRSSWVKTGSGLFD